WAAPNSGGYMESHDEERVMFRSLQSGNSSGSYSVKNLNTALSRMKAAATLFYTIPGPKMLWQFGELGYDVSIEQGGRTSAKPIKWDYYADPARKSLFTYVAQLIKAKTTYPIFNTTDVVVSGGSSLLKQIALKTVPFVSNPTKTDDMNLHAVANFDVTANTISINFSHTGKWYDWITNQEFNITAIPTGIEIPPGGFYLLTDVPLQPLVTTGTEMLTDGIDFYPNPTLNVLNLKQDQTEVTQVIFFNAMGSKVKPKMLGYLSWDLSELSSGVYIVMAQTPNGIIRKRIVKM
ncbi:MAG: T9SS type A sorting domain-containing protein, partial [Flammeovirgaceae bacterium]